MWPNRTSNVFGALHGPSTSVRAYIRIVVAEAALSRLERNRVAKKSNLHKTSGQIRRSSIPPFDDVDLSRAYLFPSLYDLRSSFFPGGTRTICVM